jgi:hypothetical protein
MARLLIAIATTGVLCIASQTDAADSTGQRTMSRRQTIAQIGSCMKRRMSADKDISYREALKACKNLLDQGGDNLHSDVVVASDTRVKP